MRRRKRKLFRLMALVLLAALGFTCYIRIRMMPLIEQLSIARVNNVVSRIINTAIDDQIAENEISYDKMTLLQKDLNGNITALSTNMAEVNRLKTSTLSLLNKRLYDISVEDIGIALGSLLAPEFFSGRGPQIPVRIISCSMSAAEFRNVFSAAGINQTLHRILMDVTVTVSVLMPTGTRDVDVTSEVVVAETVIVGTVPDKYVNFSGVADQAAAQYYSMNEDDESDEPAG
ncbi:MAG: sporulation protein YunB [Oscillospiraceae bacterium]|nr:sporulation protein YunB [Oscillospiraceae bacterium]